jgi:hypothetical protein
MKAIVAFLCLLVPATAQEKHKIGVARFENPAYPPIARSARVQGVVRVKLHIAPDGVPAVTSMEGHPMLKPSVIDSISRWKFTCMDCSYGSSYEHSISFDFQLPQEGDSTTKYDYQFPDRIAIISSYWISVDTEPTLRKKRWWNPRTWR